MCPIMSKIKGNPFEVVLAGDAKITGAILSDQFKSLDWRARSAKRFAKASKEVMREVLAKIHTLVADDDL